MGASRDYIRWLRSKVGHERIILNFVGGCIFNGKGEVLLQRRGDSSLWGFPGGAIEPGESICEAAIREIKEETGLDVEVKKLIGIYTDPCMEYPNGDLAHSICIGVEFGVLGGTLGCDHVETLELKYFPLDAPPPLFCMQHENLLRDIRQKRCGVID
ncbi:MAG: NUDIX domain-containing protein [Clostridia bacterium]|nr:NUDIX domain-containing protein [Clostridia bacterium]